MKKIILLLFVIPFVATSFAQSTIPEVISNGGDFFANSNYSIAWTIGEPVIETAVGVDNTLTQGFHQGLYTLVNIEKQINNVSVSVYPNPTTDKINIDINGANTNDYQIQLFDNLGKLLLSKSYNKNQVISIKQYASSVYYLRIFNNTDNKFDTYKILKK